MDGRRIFSSLDIEFSFINFILVLDSGLPDVLHFLQMLVLASGINPVHLN